MFLCNYEYILNLGTGLKVLNVLIHIETAKTAVSNTTLAVLVGIYITA